MHRGTWNPEPGTRSYKMTTTTNYQDTESKVMFQTGRRAPVTLVRGEGTRVWDTDGREYLDFVAGIAVVSLGHAHPALVEAIQRQAEQLIHISNLYYSVPQVQLAELLVQVSCLDRVYFQNSGAEALEACIKLARKWGHEKKRSEEHTSELQSRQYLV